MEDFALLSRLTARYLQDDLRSKLLIEDNNDLQEPLTDAVIDLTNEIIGTVLYVPCTRKTVRIPAYEPLDEDTELPVYAGVLYVFTVSENTVVTREYKSGDALRRLLISGI